MAMGEGSAMVFVCFVLFFFFFLVAGYCMAAWFVLKQHLAFDVWLLFFIVKGVQQWLAGFGGCKWWVFGLHLFEEQHNFLKAIKHQILGCIVLEA
jgi:hypothetical protein